ncbi:glycosyltransferase family protein [Pelagibacterales bacterium SAG-MED32]|nr:glycosyltransferase family protein [Pelagibacterales bacterium SAG-MED32]
MTSSRLPGKPILKVNGVTMLDHLINRLKNVDIIDEIVVATTENSDDDVLVKIAKEAEVAFYRGEEHNVTGRVIKAARHHDAKTVVQITGDCPIIDHNLVDQVIRVFLNNNSDFVSIGNVRSYPDGMDVSVFELSTLMKSYEMTSNEKHREHVTLHIRENPEIFSHINIMAPKKMFWPELGLTLDENKDYLLIKKIIENFSDNPLFSCEDAIDFLRKHPDLINLNKDVKRKIVI